MTKKFGTLQPMVYSKEIYLYLHNTLFKCHATLHSFLKNKKWKTISWCMLGIKGMYISTTWKMMIKYIWGLRQWQISSKQSREITRLALTNDQLNVLYIRMMLALLLQFKANVELWFGIFTFFPCVYSMHLAILLDCYPNE